jgi:tRNA G18 (ribose-2'-O)-methylase SpoU
VAHEFEIRICRNCGLRYPASGDRLGGGRCPSCLGDTRLVEKIQPNDEQNASQSRPGTRLGSILLDNIRSAWNVGSILRTADGFGIRHAYLCGITPTPEHEAVRKTSLGAEAYLTWTYHKNAVQLAKGLKRRGRIVWSLEERGSAIRLGTGSGKIARRTPRERIVLVLGNELTGVDRQLREMSDEVWSIPMQGWKRSFNVAVAFGIAAFALLSE